MTFDLDAHFDADERTRDRTPFATPLEKFNPNQPRIPAGSPGGGRWTDGAFGGDGEGIRIIDPLGSSVLVTSDVEEAARMLARGQKVRLTQKRQVSVLLEHLRDLVADAKAKGEKAPNYNLCDVTVHGTSVFCVQSKGIPRVQMPQLKGEPTKGSKADALPRDPRGEVTLEQQFREHLISKGVTIEDTREQAHYLKATQNELNGAKVAGIAQAYTEGKLAQERLFVSGDNYIVDGHHRWASILGTDLADNIEGDHYIDVARIDMDIISLLDEANRFAEDWGIPQAGFNAGFAKQALDAGCATCGDSLVDPFHLIAKYNPSQPRAPRGSSNGGQWIKDGGDGWTSPILNRDVALGEIKRALPRALVDIDDSFSDGAVSGLAEGFSRMASEFPEVAKEIVLVRVQPDTTPGMGETIVTTVRKPDGSEATGFGVLLNSEHTDYASYEQEWSLAGTGHWGFETSSGAYSHRGNVGSTANYADWVAAIAVHEFAHVIHNVSTAKSLKEPLYSGTGKNDTLWDEVTGMSWWGDDTLPKPRDSEHLALIDYIEADGPPPSLYGGYGPAEAIAEAMTFRYGPKGSGLMGTTELDPALEDIIVRIEEDARG